MASDTDIAWLAGLLEGEGHFRVLQDRRGRPRLRVELSMTDRDVVARASAVLPCGGNVRYAAAREATHKYYYRLDWHGQHAEAVMRAVLPYMGVRRAVKICECLATPDLSHTPRKATT